MNIWKFLGRCCSAVAALAVLGFLLSHGQKINIGMFVALIGGGFIAAFLLKKIILFGVNEND